MRPTDGPGTAAWSYGGADASYYDSDGGNVRVWYTTEAPHAPDLTTTGDSDVPDTVRLAADIAEEALAFYATLGFRAPLGDGDYPACASNGDGSRLDIYLFDFANSDGTIVAELCDASSGGSPCSGFMIIENDFKGLGYDSAEAAFKTVVPHELFHLVQNAYSSQLDLWWTEGTAQWATKRLYPELQDLESYLPSFFSDVDRPLDLPPAGAAQPYNYGSAIWPVFLDERFGSAAVVETFAAAADGDSTTGALDVALRGHDASLAEAYAEFALWNAATGSRAGSDGYADADTYPVVAVTDLPAATPSSVDDVSAGLNSRYFSLERAEPVSVSLEGTGPRGFLLPLQDGVAQLAEAEELPALAEGSALVVVVGTSTNKVDAPFTVHVDPAEDLPAATPSSPKPDMPDSGGDPASAGTLGEESGCAMSYLRVGGLRWLLAIVGLLGVVTLRRRA